ncbi:hypothetical protein ACI65C_006128 [Semiaphis heraclei]
MFMATSIGMQHAVDKLQSQIDVTLPWLKSWRLTLNTDKTLAIKFGGRGLKSTTPLRINNKEINWKTPVKYLGVLLDSRLRFNRHVTETVQKARRSRAALYPVLNHQSLIPTMVKLNIYKMYIKPIINYAGPAWGALISNANWKTLEAVQNISLRTITGSPCLQHHLNKQILHQEILTLRIEDLKTPPAANIDSASRSPGARNEPANERIDIDSLTSQNGQQPNLPTQPALSHRRVIDSRRRLATQERNGRRSFDNPHTYLPAALLGRPTIVTGAKTVLFRTI